MDNPYLDWNTSALIELLEEKSLGMNTKEFKKLLQACLLRLLWEAEDEEELFGLFEC